MTSFAMAIWEITNKSYTFTTEPDTVNIKVRVYISSASGVAYVDDISLMPAGGGGGGYDPITYTYDAIGNITSQSVGSTTTNYIYDTVHKHAVNQISLYGTDYYYTYDDNGNMTSGPDFTNPAQIASRTITYNADNMPVRIEHAGTVVTNFLYDGNGVRAKKDVQGGGTTFYVNKNFEVINGEPVGYIFAGNLRIAKITASDSNYFHKDHLGSSTVMTDETGTPVEASEYMPFGHLRDHIGTEVTDYKFTDQELDPSTNLYNYDARLYDPVIGRFISPDPFVQNPFDPQSLNRYSYCLNDPLIYTDPSGYWAVDVEAAIGFGGWGIAIGLTNSGEGLFGSFSIGSIIGTSLTATYSPTAEPQEGLTAEFGASGGKVIGAKSTVTVDKGGKVTSDVSFGFGFGLAGKTGTLKNTVQIASWENNDSNSTSPDSSGDWSGVNDPYSENDDGTTSDGGGTIICSELYRQGLMAADIYKADAAFGVYIREHNPNVIIGYHYLCKPIVKLMQTSKTITTIVNIFAKPWSHEMAYQVGAKQESNMIGRIIMSIGIPICALVGAMHLDVMHILNIVIFALLFVLVNFFVLTYANKTRPEIAEFGRISHKS